jgi:hypothetical protein
MRSRLLIFILVLIKLTGNAQIVKRPFIIETKVHAGMNFPFYKALTYLINDDIYAFDLSVSFPTFGENYWEKLYNYPRTGAGISVMGLGNNEVFGTAYALYGFFNAPLFEPSDKLSFNYQVAFGAAYLPKIFDVYENHLNRAIGSHINTYIRLGIDSKMKIFRHSELILEAGFTHISNGKTRSPNYGINEGSISLGINYFFNDYVTGITEPEIPAIRQKFIQSVIYSAGSKVYDNLFGVKYFTSSVSYNLERFINHVSKIGIGADLSYDGSISEALASDDGIPEKDFSKLIRSGLHASYAIRYKKLLMGINVGYYYYSKYTVLSRVYNKILVQYLVTENIFGSIAIKSHMGKADCLEFGIGYCW